MQMTRLIVLGVAFAGTIVVLGAVLFYFAQHHSKRVSAQAAEAEFQRLRDRFAGQTPLLDMESDVLPLTRVGRPQPLLHAFHTIVFDTRGGERLVQVTVPYRFGGLFGRGGFR